MILTASLSTLVSAGVCNGYWEEEEEDAQLVCYMHVCLKESDTLPHEITNTCPGREWHDSIFSSFYVA
jgi:hypothetical protein